MDSAEAIGSGTCGEVANPWRRATPPDRAHHTENAGGPARTAVRTGHRGSSRITFKHMEWRPLSASLLLPVSAGREEEINKVNTMP